VCVNHSEPIPVALVTGTQVQGNGDTYTLEYLGAGAMAVAYKAADSAGNTAVVKELLPVNDAVKHAENLRRFMREAQIQELLGKAYSQAVPFPRGMGYFNFTHQDPTGPVVRDYMVMEFIPGQSLAKLLKSSGVMSKLAVLQFAIEMCQALAFLHNFTDPATGSKHPIVHRDMKPDNVMVVTLGNDVTYKVLDFGIARPAIKSAGTQAKGPQGTIAGSAPYWSPEQLGAISGNIDGRTDIYALGATMYELLTGKQFDRTVTSRLPEVTANVSDADMQGMIKKAIAVQPTSRYQTVEEMRDELVRTYETARPLPAHLRHLSSQATPAPQRTAANTSPATPSVSPVGAQGPLPKVQILWHNGSSAFTGAGQVEYHQDCGGQVVEVNGRVPGFRSFAPLVGAQVMVARIHDLNSTAPGAVTNTVTDANGDFNLDWDDVTVPKSVQQRRLDIHIKDAAGRLLVADRVFIKPPGVVKQAGGALGSAIKQMLPNSTYIVDVFKSMMAVAGGRVGLIVAFVCAVVFLAGVFFHSASVYSLAPLGILWSLFGGKLMRKKGILAALGKSFLLMTTVLWVGLWTLGYIATR